LTTTTSAPPRGSSRNGSANGARLRPAARARSGPWVGIGVLVVVGSALAFAVTATHLGARQPVLAVAKAVPAGTVLSAGDLTVVHVAADAALRPIPAAALSSVIGRAAAVPLVPGGLLVASELGPPSALGAGSAAVGVALKPGQYPPDLAPGQTVRVVDVGTTAALSVTPAGPPAGQTVVFAATVSSLSQAPSSSSDATVVGISVAPSRDDQVAALAAANRVALVGVAAQP
jgi:hypothetical protein